MEAGNVLEPAREELWVEPEGSEGTIVCLAGCIEAVSDPDRDCWGLGGKTAGKEGICDAVEGCNMVPGA
eukprot:66106-Hanusia_phi.AAC.1